MVERASNKGDSHGDKAAEDAFTSEGGHVAAKPVAGEKHADGALGGDKRSPSKYSTPYDGRHYKQTIIDTHGL